MHLKSLNVKSYRVHDNSTLDCGDAKFILVRGPNGGGKTSLAESLSMNLCQTTVSLDKQGRGFKGKIRQVKKESDPKAVITAEIQGQHLLRSVVTLNLNTSGRTSSIECVDAPEDNKVVKRFTDFLDSRKIPLLVALNSDYMASLDEEGQKSLLAQLILPPRYDFPMDKVEATNNLLDTPIGFTGEPFEVIKKAHKKTYDEREIVNRQVKEYIIPDPLPEIKGVDSASLQVQLDNARKEREALSTERDIAVAKANQVEVERGKLQTKIEGLRAQVEKGKAQLVILESSILKMAKVKELLGITAKKDELAALRKTHDSYLGGIHAVNAQIERMRDIQDKGATCPTCDQAIDSAKIETLINDFQKEVIETDRKLKEIDKQIESIGDVHGAIQALKKHDAEVKEKQELEASLTETVKTGKATRDELNALGEKQDATLPFNDPLAAIQAKEDSINAQLRPAMAAEERKKEIATKTAHKAKLQAKAILLDTLVKFWDKDGIKAKLIAEYIGGFESKVNAVLDAFGYKTSLIMEPFSFEVETKRNYVGPVKELCKAERHLFYPAFQCAVSIAAGINMVIVDDMDSYLKETGLRNTMYGSLYQLVANGSLEQVIVIEASVDTSIPPKEKRAPGSKYFYVEEGTVRELK